jgi:hypothetical protein
VGARLRVPVDETKFFFNDTRAISVFEPGSHGTPAQRIYWFQRGIDYYDVGSCNQVFSTQRAHGTKPALVPRVTITTPRDESLAPPTIQ